jgi:hypothetical protein
MLYIVELKHKTLQSQTGGWRTLPRFISLDGDMGGWPGLWHSTKSPPLHTLILLPYVHSELRS